MQSKEEDRKSQWKEMLERHTENDKKMNEEIRKQEKDFKYLMNPDQVQKAMKKKFSKAIKGK